MHCQTYILYTMISHNIKIVVTVICPEVTMACVKRCNILIISSLNVMCKNQEKWANVRISTWARPGQSISKTAISRCCNVPVIQCLVFNKNTAVWEGQPRFTDACGDQRLACLAQYTFYPIIYWQLNWTVKSVLQIKLYSDQSVSIHCRWLILRFLLKIYIY